MYRLMYICLYGSVYTSLYDDYTCFVAATLSLQGGKFFLHTFQNGTYIVEFSPVFSMSVHSLSCNVHDIDAQSWK